MDNSPNSAQHYTLSQVCRVYSCAHTTHCHARLGCPNHKPCRNTKSLSQHEPKQTLSRQKTMRILSRNKNSLPRQKTMGSLLRQNSYVMRANAHPSYRPIVTQFICHDTSSKGLCCDPSRPVSAPNPIATQRFCRNTGANKTMSRPKPPSMPENGVGTWN